MTKRTGRCMCGTVAFEAEFLDEFSVCYCKMCQRWASGVFMGVHTESLSITQGDEALATFKFSDWAERGFCSKCGSNIYYHAKEYGGPSIAMGTLDNTADLTMRMQYFIDKRPTGFTMKNKTKTLTEAEVMAMFADPPESEAR